MATVAPGRPPRPLVPLAKGTQVLIVEGRFYDAIADALVSGALAELERHGVTAERVGVPGAFEVPGAIAIMSAHTGGSTCRYDGYVALGCVIRGETSHYDYVCGESARGLMELTVQRQLAIGYGILTVDTEDQAWARAATDRGDKGGDAAHACLSMVALRQQAGLPR
jgi:6,7-dimethyl-8-ribityllumazine synthase